MIGVDNRTGPHFSLVANDIRRIHGLKAKGATLAQIAEVIGVSKRTAQRYLASYLVTVTVEGWPVTFICRRGKRPVPVTNTLRSAHRRRVAPITESELRLLDGNR